MNSARQDAHEPVNPDDFAQWLEISGGDKAPQFRFSLPLFCLGVAAVCFLNTDLTEPGLGWGAIGVTLIVTAFLVARHKQEYLDFSTGEIVRVKSFATIVTSTDRTPLASYSKIVVRHLCHPGGESEDTFSGSVGLKPRSGAPVLWVKNFPATKDEMTGEADAFAVALAAKIGLPYDHAACGTLPERQRTES